MTFTFIMFTFAPTWSWENIYLQLVLFPVDDDGADLLVHEYENGDEESWHEASQINPPRVLPEGHDDPVTVWPRGLHEEKPKGVRGSFHLKVKANRKCERSLKKMFKFLAKEIWPWLNCLNECVFVCPLSP